MIRSYYSQSNSLQQCRKNFLLTSSTKKVLLYLTASFLAFWLIAASGNQDLDRDEDAIHSLTHVVATTPVSTIISHQIAEKW
ncbi:MAG: hypothetical protein AAF824_16420 [Bacteroidota bacterium]